MGRDPADSRPQPRRWSVLCPLAVVRLVHLSLWLLLTPRHHSRTSAVVTGRSEGSCDAQLLVSPPRALASFPSPAGTGCAAGSSVAGSHQHRGHPLGFRHEKGRPVRRGNACLCKNTCVVVVVVVVVRTRFDSRQHMHLIKVAEHRSPRHRLDGGRKIPQSAEESPPQSIRT